MGLYASSFLLAISPCTYFLTLTSSVSQQMAALPGLWAVSRWGRDTGVRVGGEALLFV